VSLSLGIAQYTACIASIHNDQIDFCSSHACSIQTVLKPGSQAYLCHAVAARHNPLLYNHKLWMELGYPSCRCQHPQMTFVNIVRSATTVQSQMCRMSVPHNCKSALDEITVTLMQSIRARLLQVRLQRYHKCHVATASEWAM